MSHMGQKRTLRSGCGMSVLPPTADIRQHRHQQPPMTGHSGYVAAQLPITGWPGARSSGGRGLASPIVPGGVSLLAVFVSTRSSVVTVAASIAIITATAKSTTAIRWLFRLLPLGKPPLDVRTICGLDSSPLIDHIPRAPLDGRSHGKMKLHKDWEVDGSRDSNDGVLIAQANTSTFRQFS